MSYHLYFVEECIYVWQKQCRICVHTALQNQKKFIQNSKFKNLPMETSFFLVSRSENGKESFSYFALKVVINYFKIIFKNSPVIHR